MKKVEIENGYKYIYRYSTNGRLLRVDMYEIKLRGLLKKHIGKYNFIYQDNKLLSQQNVIDGLGITESVNYIYKNELLKKKEYLNEKHALRYTVDFFYNKQKEVERMTITRFTGQKLADINNKQVVKDYINKVGKEVDYLSETVDLTEKN